MRALIRNARCTDDTPYAHTTVGMEALELIHEEAADAPAHAATPVLPTVTP